MLVSSKLIGKKNKRRKDIDNDTDCCGEDVNGKKKMRTTFTGKQIFELEKSFESKKYLSSAERAEMASNLNVTQQQVFNIEKHFRFSSSLNNKVIEMSSLLGQNLVPEQKNKMEEN